MLSEIRNYLVKEATFIKGKAVKAGSVIELNEEEASLLVRINRIELVKEKKAVVETETEIKKVENREQELKNKGKTRNK